MMFGLKSVPLIFQRLINDIFASMLGKIVFAYLHDIVTTSVYRVRLLLRRRQDTRGEP